MECKKCGYKLEKDWQACPVCSEQVKKKNYVFLIIGIILLVIIISGISNFVTNINSTGERGMKRYLEKEHNEKFDKITLIQSVENPDTHLSCDGANFGTIKGKGDIEYYLIYSSKNNLEFTAFYNTHTKQYQDTYKFSLDLRNYAQQLYQKTHNTFRNYIERVSFSDDTHSEKIGSQNINSAQEIDNMLSKVRDGYPDKHSGETYTRLYMYVNMNSLEFCKKEYNNIVMINKYLRELELSSKLYSQIGFSIITSDRVTLEFNRLDAVRIYDKFATGKAWGETIEEFVKRETY